MAKLYFRYGAMNSGKSTALMQVAHNYEEQGMKVLILKPQVDTKGGGELVSRLGVRRPMFSMWKTAAFISRKWGFRSTLQNVRTVQNRWNVLRHIANLEAFGGKNRHR